MRAKGAGTKRPDGRWATSVRLPDGRRRYVYGDSQTEMRQRAEALRRAVRAGEAATEDRRTVAEFLPEWLAIHKATLQATSVIKYESIIRLHLIPRIGKERLARLRPETLSALYAELLEGGLSPRTVRVVHAVLREALGQARRWRIVRENVAELVDPPRKTRYEHTALTQQQAAALLHAAEGDPLEAVYVLALQTGMRKGEILGLRWADVDLTAGRITVRGALNDRRVWTETKTTASTHAITLTRGAVAALRRRSIVQLAERSLAGAYYQESAYVFTRPEGGPVSQAQLTRRYAALRKRAGLPHFRFHDLRHTVGTRLLEAGVHPSVAASLLGHATSAETLNTYSHVMDGGQQTAVDALNTLFPEPD